MENEREQWKTQTGFIMAAVGSAVGLGNLWRFPYMAYENGGGAFLVPYLVALITAGFPLMLLEYGIGQKMRSSAPMAYAKIDPRWEWLGWWCVLIVMFGIVGLASRIHPRLGRIRTHDPKFNIKANPQQLDDLEAVTN